jgi:hypothetical protein
MPNARKQGNLRNAAHSGAIQRQIQRNVEKTVGPEPIKPRKTRDTYAADEHDRGILSILPDDWTHKEAKAIIADVLDNKGPFKFRTISGWQPENAEPGHTNVDVLEITSPSGTCAIVKEHLNWSGWVCGSIADFRSSNENWEEEGTDEWEYSKIVSISRKEAIEWLNDELNEFNRSEWGSYE